MFSVHSSLSPGIIMSASATMSTDVPATLSPRTPSPDYIASRVHSIASYKLRLEASQNEPRLRKLLGHIFVYDAIREHKQSQQPIYTSPFAQRRREQQLRRRRHNSEAALPSAFSFPSPPPSSADPSPPVDNASDIQAYLSRIPSTIPANQAHDFAAFQRAIAHQLATLSQVRIEAASRQLYHMTQDNDSADEVAVEEYAPSEGDSDSDDSSDYDSYDGDDWRDRDGWVFDHLSSSSPSTSPGSDDADHDSDTDPDSVNSAPPSPTGDFGADCQLVDQVDDAKPKGTVSDTPTSSRDGDGGLTQATGACYFLPLRPVPCRARRSA